MAGFGTMRLPVARDDVAPDGSDVRVLLSLSSGGLAHFELAPGKASFPIAHRTVSEIWFFLTRRCAAPGAGRGRDRANRSHWTRRWY